MAAVIAGIDKIFKTGGAQAVAALAYGTESIPAVDKIVGPGNIYVATAKRKVFGKVGIDMIAGPSEILVLADGSCNPAWVAADLLSQAEHDESAQSILITDSADLAKAVSAAVDKHLETLERRAIAGASWRDYGAVILVNDLDQAAALSPLLRIRPGAAYPPFLIFHVARRQDSAAQSRALAEALIRAGGHAEVVPAPNDSHMTIKRDFGVAGDPEGERAARVILG